MRNLQDIRSEIDDLDAQIVERVTRRLDLANEIAAVKKASGSNVFDPSRETALLKRLAVLAGPEHEADIRTLYATLLTLSKARQYALLGIRTPAAPSDALLTDLPPLGTYLKLQICGASHAPFIGMRLEHFPRGFRVKLDVLQAFMQRRAPGRDELSSQRKEADHPDFLSGLQDDMTTGDVLEAVIRNTDSRTADYDSMRTIPRPGHADFTQWVQTGRIPPGGGRHSGRMTAMMCVAGGICLQWLASRGISVTGRLMSAGGQTEHPDEAILAAAQAGDSVGGVVEVMVNGLRPGLGGALFGGVEKELSAALFSIPGVKGLEFGGGFTLADRRGSEANDAFVLRKGRFSLDGNNHGGLLGGITTGMPLVFRLAFKPTPSIYQPQRSVDLADASETTLVLQGRHDPCIARRAVPVAEAMTAFVLADLMLADEASRPRICLTLTESTVEQNLSVLQKHQLFCEMGELRADFLSPEQMLQASDFPRKAGIPVILTLRRKQDGGCWTGTEEERQAILARLLQKAEVPFAFIDLEDDFHPHELEVLAHERGTRIIRSLHNFMGPVKNLVGRMRQMKGSTEDIPKIAFRAEHCSDLELLFRETASFTDFLHIVCAMGTFGQVSRILAVRTHSMLTFASTEEAQTRLKALGHLSPEKLVTTYRFRSLTEQTEEYAVTGWPLDHTLSPELNNAAFFSEGRNAIMVPLPAETAAEALRCAEALRIRAMAVTVPHKTEMLALMSTLSPEAEAVGAVNTVIRTHEGWYGANTDIAGFRKALLAFLKCTDLSGKKVAILGAGGAAQAVAAVISDLHGDACIFNRTVEKAVQLAARHGFKAAALCAADVALLSEYSPLIVQCTSIGLSSRCSLGEPTDPIPFYTFCGHECVYDLIYSPAETPLLARAREAGCQTENGLSMLIAQAAEQRSLINFHRPGFC